MIPADYTISVNGKMAAFTYHTLESMYHDLLDSTDFVGNMRGIEMCRKCPLRNICNGLEEKVNHMEMGMDLRDSELKLSEIYNTFMNAGLDALFLMTHLILKHHPHWYRKISLMSFAKYISEEKNAVIMLSKPSFIQTPEILSLNDGEIYGDPLKMIRKNPEIRVYGDRGDITDYLLAQAAVRDAAFNLNSCEKVRNYLNQFPENEKYIVYLSFFGLEDIRGDDEYASEEEKDEIDIYLNEGNGLIDVISAIHSSKLYSEGLIEFDDEQKSVYPTKKLINILSGLCREGIE